MLPMRAGGDDVRALQSAHAFLRLQNHFNLSKVHRWETFKKQIIFPMLGKKETPNYRICVKLQCEVKNLLPLPLRGGDLHHPELHSIRPPRGQGMAEPVTALGRFLAWK